MQVLRYISYILQLYMTAVFAHNQFLNIIYTLQNIYIAYKIIYLAYISSRLKFTITKKLNDISLYALHPVDR
jgi:hypothetical protein